MTIGNLSAHQAALLADELEARAFTDLYAAAPTALQQQLGLQVHAVADATVLVASRIPSSMFNRVIGLGLQQAVNEAVVDELRDLFVRAGVAHWWLHWNPHALPAETPAYLQTLGFTAPARRSWAKVLRTASPVTCKESTLRVAVASESQLADTTNAITQAFEMPPFMGTWLRVLLGRAHWRVYAVLDHDEVVGGGCLYCDDIGAWLGMGGVVASHRRRGGQSLLMAQRINDAIASGCTYIATETGEPIYDEPNPSLQNMWRHGFECVASRLNFAAPI